VTRIEGIQAWITYREPEGEKAKTERQFWKVREAEFPARIPPELILAAGDYVEIYIPPGKTVISAFTVLLFPLLMFPVFYLAAGYMPGPKLPESLKGLAGLGGVVFGFLVNVIIAVAQRRRGREWNPEITRIITQKEMCADSPRKDCAGCGLCT
jgi:positive regulator of sigma E activity